MKKFLSYLLVTALLFSLTACGGTGVAPTDAADSIPSTEVPDNMEKEYADERYSEDTDKINDETSIPEQTENSSNILIAYFTWAENTYVEDPDAVDVDATTSASVLPPGNAAKIAGWIQEEVGGDLFSIVVTEPYSSDYDECLNRAADEKAADARPELLYHVENMDNYDIVFLGFPNWWYTVPMAVHTFLEEYDFSGKTIVPFVTHGTGGLSQTIQDITADLPDSVTILEPIGVYRPEVDASRPAVQEWVSGLDLGLSQAQQQLDTDILIAYFTRLDNTDADVDEIIQGGGPYGFVGNSLEDADIDALSSASIAIIDGQPQGNVETLAEMIQEITGGDLFSIRTTETYPVDYDELIDRGGEEKGDNIRPELSVYLDNMEDYEIVFIGFPNWWNDMPMAVYSFFEEYDFSGKRVIPFAASAGSGFSDTKSSIRNLLPDAEVEENGLHIPMRNVADSRPQVEEWLEELEIG